MNSEGSTPEKKTIGQTAVVPKTQELNKIMSEQKEEVKSSGKEKQLVVFNLAEEEYAIEIHKTREIIERPEITKIPNSPKFITGLINIRGKIVSIIDLGERFNLQNTKRKQILVTEINEEQFGLLIDEVIEIKKVSEDLIKNAPSILAEKIHLDYITGVAVLEKRLIIILDIEKILNEEELKKVLQMEQAKKIAIMQSTKSQQKAEEKKEVIENIENKGPAETKPVTPAPVQSKAPEKTPIQNTTPSEALEEKAPATTPVIPEEKKPSA